MLMRAWANALSNMVSKLLESQLTNLFTGGGGGGAGLLGLLGLGGGGGTTNTSLFGGGSDFGGSFSYDVGQWGGLPVFGKGGVSDVPSIFAESGAEGCRTPSRRAQDPGRPRGGASGTPTVHHHRIRPVGPGRAVKEDVSWDAYNGVLSIMLTALDSDTRVKDSVKRASR